MNLIDIILDTDFNEFVVNVLFGVALAFVVPYVNVTLSELYKRNLFPNDFGCRLLVYIVVSFPLAVLMILTDVQVRMLICIPVALFVIFFINRDKMRKQVKPVIKWFARYQYKSLMRPYSVRAEIKYTRNLYCLKEWLESGWRLPNGEYLCDDEERFRRDLAKVILECSTHEWSEWQIATIRKCGYKLRGD